MSALKRWAQVRAKDQPDYAVYLSEGKNKDPLLLVRGTLQLFVSAVASNPSAVTDIAAFLSMHRAWLRKYEPMLR